MKISFPSKFAVPQLFSGASFDRLSEALARLVRARPPHSAHRQHRRARTAASFGILIPLDRSVARERAKLSQKRADLAWMQSVAPELASSAPPPSATGESLLVIIDRSARESGLASSITGSEPGAAGSLSHPPGKGALRHADRVARAPVAAERRVRGLRHHRKGRRAGSGQRRPRPALGLM